MPANKYTVFHRVRARRRLAPSIAVVTLAMAGVGLPALPALAQSAAPAPSTSTGSAAPRSGSPSPRSTASPGASDSSGLTAAQSLAASQASAQAKKAGQSIAINDLTTETWQVSALPSGEFSLTDNPVPVRTMQHGSWVPVDTTLAKNANGTYSPAATAYATVVFSGGGSTQPLVSTTTATGATYQLSWPTPLPDPTVSGPTAVYTNVLPGVDLQVSANVTGGFSDDLVVHTAAAAANPALASIKLAVHTTGTHQTPGALAETSDGMSLSASGAMMWDSNTALQPTTGKAASAATASAPSLAQMAAADPSAPDAPGFAAHQAPIKVAASGTALTLTPNPQLLTGRDTVFPLNIDPTLSWHNPPMAAPAYDEVKQDSPCNSQSYYNDTGIDDNALGVGYISSSCGGIQRTYYQWQLPAVLHGAVIKPDTANNPGAVVNATEDYQSSWSCTNSRTVYLHWAGSIGSGTDYNNQPGYLGGSSAYTTSTSVGAAQNPDGCQNPKTSAAAFIVTGPIQTSATNGSSQFTVALDQGGDTNSADFDRFTDNPSLNIQFDFPPSAPTATQLQASSSASNVAPCTTTTPYATIGKAIVTNPPTLAATDLASFEGDEVNAQFQYTTSLSSTPVTLTSADVSSGGTATVSLPSSATAGMTTGATVSWQVRVYNGYLYSSWSPNCTFSVEPTAPNPPVITSSQYPRDGNGTNPPEGTAGTFVITGDPSVQATEFYYKLDQPPATSGTPLSEIDTADDNAGSVTITPLATGPHTLYVDAVDAAGDVSSNAVYPFVAAGHSSVSYPSLAAAFNNSAISPAAYPSAANADGGGYSFSADDLKAAGWTSGSTITIDGAQLTLPTYNTAGQTPVNDNVLAANQSIDFAYTAPVTGASSLVFLASTTDGASLPASSGEVAGTALNADTSPFVPAGAAIANTYSFQGNDGDTPQVPKGTITYQTGSPTDYYLPVPDWVSGPSSIAAVTLPSRNNANGSADTANHPKIYAFFVPIAPGASVTSVQLPDVATTPGGQALHIFSMGTRNTTAGTAEVPSSGHPFGYTVASPAGQSWTGAWASDTEGDYNFKGGSFQGQTFRVLVQSSATGASAGSTVRIKLDDALGTSPITIGHATVATTNGTAAAPTAVTSSTPVSLAFDGSQSTTIPEGGMVFSDPLTLPFAVTAGQWLAVSFDVTNAVPYLPEHTWATSSYEYVTPPNTPDASASTGNSAFIATGSSNGAITNLLTGLDIQTAGQPTDVVIGDNLVDAGQPGTAALSSSTGSTKRLSDILAGDSPTTPDPFGTVNAGIASNEILTDYPETLAGGTQPLGGPSLLSRIDRDVLDEPGISTAVIDEGLDDALVGATAGGATSSSVSNNIGDGYSQILTYVSGTPATNTYGYVQPIAVGLTPCGTYAGDGASINDPCNATVDAARVDFNESYLPNNPDGLGIYSDPPLYYIDPDPVLGATNPTGPETELAAQAMVGTSNGNTTADPVNLTNAGTGVLANTILAAQDQWLLNDGNASTTAADSTQGTANPYLAQTAPGLVDTSDGYPLNLAGGYTWTTPTTVKSESGITVLGLDGSTANGTTDITTGLDTQNSFSISAWAYLTSIPTQNATIAAESGTTVDGQDYAAGYYLQYNAGQNGWCFVFMNADQTDPQGSGTPCATAVSHTWYHLVGVYNALTHKASLYVNGALVGTVSNITNWDATGLTTIGSAIYDNTMGDWFPGQISDVESWSYSLALAQITALYDQIQ
jgi:hypothetical protein